MQISANIGPNMFLILFFLILFIKKRKFEETELIN